MSGQPLLCPKCMAQVHPDWPYCTHCGSKLESSAPAFPVCENCGAAVDTSGAFCWKCGVPLDTGRQPFIPTHPDTPEAAGGPRPEGLSAMASMGDQSARPSVGPTRDSSGLRPGAFTPGTPAASGGLPGGTADPVASRSATFPAKRLAASLVFLVAGVLAGLSSITSWWTLSESGSTFTGSIGFLPGDSYQASGDGVTASGSYASDGLGPVGSMYEGVLALVLVVLILALVAGIIGVVASFSRTVNPARYYTVRNLLVVTLILATFATVLVPTLQPTLFHNSNPSDLCSSSSGTQTPCNSFWGSLSAGGESSTWGSDLGWYLSLATVVLSVGGLFVWRAGRQEPWGSRDLLVPNFPSSRYPEGGFLASPTHLTQTQPTAGPSVISSSGAASGRFCPSCGAGNEADYSFCQRCGKRLPTPS